MLKLAPCVDRPQKSLFSLALLIMAGLVAGSPAGNGQQPAPTGPNLAIQSYRLPNGLKVVLHKDPAVPRVSVCVAYHVGSKNEVAGRTGFAHFFEHMMFRGTSNVPNYDIPLQEAGAQSNAFTSEDMTVYYETVPSDFLKRALYLEAERLAFLPSALDQDKFDTEREVVKNERRQSVDNVPYGQAHEALLAAVYPAGHPYSWSVIGSMSDLDAASLDDLRRFFYRFYHPGNATLCLAGDFDTDQAKAWIEEYFAPLKPGTPVPAVVPPATPPVDRELTLADQVQFPRLYWTWPTVADDHPDAPALDLLATILTEGDASRLIRALVRDQRVAQDVSASSDTNEIGGQFTIQATAAEGQTIDAVRELLSKELARLQQEPATQAELERAKAKYEKSTYAALTAPLGRAMVLAIGFSQKDDPNWYRTDFARYMKVSVADLNRVANTYLVPKKVELIVRPATAFDPPKEPVVAGAGPSPNDLGKDAPLPDRTPAPGPDWAAMPGPSSLLPFQPPAFKKATLSNGVEVWVGEWHTLPLVSMRLLVPVGTGDDPDGKNGLAALTGRLLEQGTQTKSATEFAESLDNLGASLAVSTGPDHTAYNMSVLAHQLEKSLGLLGEAVQQPRFDPADFDREKDLLLTDLRQGPDSPTWIAQRALRALLFGRTHPYGQPAQGYESTVKALTLADVKQFHADRFGPDKAILVIVGDVKLESLIPSLEKAIDGGWKNGKDAGPQPRPAVQQTIKPGAVYVANKKGAVQSVISVGRRWVDRTDPSYFATLIGNRILGADFLSRLNQNLREEHGYSYGAGSGFTFRRSGSSWSASTSVRADVTAEALREVIKELDGIAGDRPFTVEEIDTARDAEAQSYPESFEAPGGIAAVLEEIATHHLPLNYVEKYLGQLQATEGTQVEQAMTKLVKAEDRVILIVGDSDSILGKLEELGFTNIIEVDADGKITGK